MVGGNRGSRVWGRALALLIAICSLVLWSCSSGSSGPPKGSGEIPPPLNQPCSADAECEPFGLKCDPLRGCVPCVFDWQCASGERCTDAGCKVPSACADDGDCKDAKAPHCDPVLAECVGCRGEADCPESSHCVERSCVSYKKCVNSRDCADGTVCDRDRGECVECLGNGDCEKDAEVCVATHCVPTCTSDKDCLSRNQLCHHEKGYCADCVEQEDCPGVYYCADDLCKLDVCKAGETTCTGPSTFQQCNLLGSQYDTIVCPTSTSCVDVAGQALCKPWICTPYTKDCDEAGEKVRTCAADGLSYAAELDCTDDGQLCHMAECKPKLCEPGSLFCQGNEIHECTANGTDSVLSSTCNTYQYCAPDSVSCVARACTPGEALCDGSVATTCDDLGSGPADGGTDCADDGRICGNGACHEVVCEPGRYCKDDGFAYSCNADGTVESLAEACASNKYCKDGYCNYDTCTAGAALCQGQVATTCKADGSGAEAGGSDCSASGKVCDAGVCKPKVCEPSTYYCADGNPHYCNSLGTAPQSQSDTCSASEYCKDGTYYCLADVCSQGQKMCDGNLATTCAADGSGPAAGGTDCTATGKVCYQGTCLPKVCEPSQYYCQDGNSYYCGSTGATSSLNDTCLASEYCKAGSYYCQPDVCTAGQPTCSGDNLSTCAADGSGPVDAGKSCGAGKTCFAGACQAVVCTADALQCAAGNVQKCVDKGTAWAAYQTCSASSYCNELATPITCSPDQCSPGGNACNGEKLATCDTDGGHFSATSTNCATTNKVCSLGGTCLATALDTVGDASASASLSNYMLGDMYRVDRDRTLTQIEEYLSVSGTSIFTWVVYESASGSGYFDKVAEVTNSASGSGAFISSGPLSVALHAGKYYIIGVVVQGTFTRYYQSASALPFVSFGQQLGSQLVSGSTAPLQTYGSGSSSIHFYQRLSTAKP